MRLNYQIDQTASRASSNFSKLVLGLIVFLLLLAAYVCVEKVSGALPTNQHYFENRGGLK